MDPFRLRIAAMVAAASLSPATPSVAHDDLEEVFANCTCVAKHSRPSQPLARVTRAEGNVYATDRDGYRDVVTGMPLQEGTEVTTGFVGSATIIVGENCRLDINAGSQVRVTLPAGPTHDICAAKVEWGLSAVPEQIRIGAAIQTLVGFGISGIALGGGDNPASN